MAPFLQSWLPLPLSGSLSPYPCLGFLCFCIAPVSTSHQDPECGSKCTHTVSHTKKRSWKKSRSWENPCPSLQPWDCLRLLLLCSSHTNFYLPLTLIPLPVSQLFPPLLPLEPPPSSLPSSFLLSSFSIFHLPTSHFKPPTAELICSWLGDWSPGCRGNQMSCLGGEKWW